MQRTFNPQNRARYPGGPPFLPGRLIVGQRPLKARMRVQFQPRQPISAWWGNSITSGLPPEIKGAEPSRATIASWRNQQRLVSDTSGLGANPSEAANQQRTNTSTRNAVA